MIPKFAINRTVSPFRDLTSFLAVARGAGVQGVEIRNDVEGQEFANGLAPRELASRVAEAGLTIASINALQRFNDWNAERAQEARFLIEYAATCGAPGIVLCPVVDERDGRSPLQLDSDLCRSLLALKPVLADNGVIGLVEPLGMPASTLKFKGPAVAAIEDVDGFGSLALCHDTFQHFRCGDHALYPQHTRLVHVSGISRRDLPPERLQEPDRGFVGADDIAGNVEQVIAFLGAGYDGFISFEPFDPVLQAHPDPGPALAESIRYLSSTLANTGAGNPATEASP